MTSAKNFGERRISSRTTAKLTQVPMRDLNLFHDNLHADHLLDILGFRAANGSFINPELELQRDKHRINTNRVTMCP